MRRYFELFDDVVEGLRFSAGELEPRGDWVLAKVTVTGSGRSSGAPVEMSVVMAVRVDDGRITRMVAHPDRAAARSALG